jgi:hypothetical protein
MGGGGSRSGLCQTQGNNFPKYSTEVKGTTEQAEEGYKYGHWALFGLDCILYIFFPSRDIRPEPEGCPELGGWGGGGGMGSVLLYICPCDKNSVSKETIP